jgi:uncharacterized repeat protein (TIGR03803 family)
MKRKGVVPFATCLLAMLITTLLLAIGANAGSRETVSYRFQSGQDGAYAGALIADATGNLYGVTSYGGGGPCSFNGQTGCGTIYRLTAPAKLGGVWKESVLYRFAGASDGAFPGSDLIIDRAGNLYGTTNAGGIGCAIGCGTAFELMPPSGPGRAWKKIVLYAFQGGADGFGPVDLIANSSGNFFGVTYFGGLFANCTYGCGTAFELTRQPRGGAWKKTTVYFFKGTPGNATRGDGSAPIGMTLGPAGDLFGTTNWGGTCDPSGCFGTAFRLDLGSKGAATESVIYRFSDGAHQPVSPFVVGNARTLYGTGYYDVYQLTYGAGGWTESDIYDANSFFYGGVILDRKGDLYGTAAGGGEQGAGYVYRLAPPLTRGGGWSVSVLYEFESGIDGDTPDAPPVLGKWGNLYGTTLRGGNQKCKYFSSVGCGTVFQIAP